MALEPAHDDLLNLLSWYGELGVDAVLDDVAVDWLEHGDLAPGDAIRQAVAGSHAAQSAPQGSQRNRLTGQSGAGRGPMERPRPGGGNATRNQADAAPRPRAAAAASSALNEPGPAAARKAAAEAKTLEQLKTVIDDFEGCALRATAKNTCFYRGAAQSRLMVIGEAPGRDEDIAGKPFVGRAGHLLDRMLGSIGLSEDDVHITNVVYWRPPGNRTPTLQETNTCRPFLERQAQFVAPEYVLLVGGSAAKSVLDLSEGIMKLRGKWRELTIGGHNVKALATLHPAYLLRTPAAKRLAWRDLINLRKALDSSVS